MTEALLPELCGDDALRVRIDDAGDRRALAARLIRAANWLEVVQGMTSVAVQFDPLQLDSSQAIATFRKQLAGVSAVASAAPGPIIEIPVCYGGIHGPDLNFVADQLGLSPDTFIARHTAIEFTVDLLGFTPGFAYVAGLPADLSVGRLASPRQRVPAGSVGVAGRHSGLYALAGPGGWPIIGRTPMALFDAGCDAPFRLTAGQPLRFVALDVSAWPGDRGESTES